MFNIYNEPLIAYIQGHAESLPQRTIEDNNYELVWEKL